LRQARNVASLLSQPLAARCRRKLFVAVSLAFLVPYSAAAYSSCPSTDVVVFDSRDRIFDLSVSTADLLLANTERIGVSVHTNPITNPGFLVRQQQVSRTHQGGVEAVGVWLAHITSMVDP
jgi:hypothetical protein